MKIQRLTLFISLEMLLISPMIIQVHAAEFPELIVKTEFLDQHLNDPHLVILHYGKPEDFRKEHIPGARLVSLKELVVEKENGLKHELPDKSVIESVFKSWGISKDSRIVICYAEKNLLPMAARLYFTMDYAGLGKQTSILDGGLKKWKEEGRQLTSQVTELPVGNFKIKKCEPIVVNMNWVRKKINKKSTRMVDARPEDLYAGSIEDNNSPRRGHIESAVNIPFTSLINDSTLNTFRSAEELKILFEKNNIIQGAKVVTYCGTGIWASPVYFIAKLLGYRVLFYDGSFQEWGNNKALPVTQPERQNMNYPIQSDSDGYNMRRLTN